MGKILDFFRGKPERTSAGRSFEEILAELRPHAIPAMSLRKTDAARKSYLGGDPQLPPDTEWPSKNGHRLTFLASIDLGEVSAADATPWLPDEGRLLFFYDADNQPWGFDPADRGSWAVIHAEAVGAVEIAPDSRLPRYSVEFEKADSLPDWERFKDLGIELGEGELDAYEDGYYEWPGCISGHQIGGYPRPVQGDDMELECQLVSNGLYCGDSTGYQSDEGQRLAPGAKDWRLLFQFASDEDLDVMWGDLGDLYFWIRRQDLEARDFSNVWLVLQCH